MSKILEDALLKGEIVDKEFNDRGDILYLSIRTNEGEVFLVEMQKYENVDTLDVTIYKEITPANPTEREQLILEKFIERLMSMCYD